MPEGASPAPEEDARLVRRAREGDPDAFEALVRRHLRAAQGLALRTTGNVQDAEDVCQDAFLTALRRIEDCRHPDRFRAWLLTIVRNTALNSLARERRRRTEPLEAAGQRSGADDPERDLERRNLGEALGRRIDALPETQRKVLLMHDYEGWSHGEIGRELGIAAGTSRYHLHEARKAVRRAMEGDPEPE